MRIADPFIMIIHVIGSLRVIHDFGPTAGAVVSGCCEHSSHQLNCGIAGAAMCGPGSGAILEALPTPLGSTATLFNPPAFAGPRAILTDRHISHCPRTSRPRKSSHRAKTYVSAAVSAARE